MSEYCDHIYAAGEESFACRNDLEGIVAKHKFGPYLEDSTQWFKISNRKYSQWQAGRSFSNASARSILI